MSVREIPEEIPEDIMRSNEIMQRVIPEETLPCVLMKDAFP